VTDPRFIERYAPIDDLACRAEGGRRIIDAYASVFGIPQEIRDREGHYIEEIDRTAFDRSIAQRGDRIQVMFNHGLTMHGTPAERFSMPIGRAVEVRPDARGLWTSTEIADTELGSEVYELVQSGAIRGMSFSGPVYTTEAAGRDDATGLPIKRRTELGLREYGPTPFPAYHDAQIVAARSLVFDDLSHMTAEEIRGLVADLPDTVRANLARALDAPVTGTVSSTPPSGHGLTLTRQRQIVLAQLHRSI
jgi:HK97 family phage prohead protease